MTPDVVMLVSTTVTFCPACVPPIFTGDAVATGAYLKPVSNVIENDFSLPAFTIELLEH